MQVKRSALNRPASLPTALTAASATYMCTTPLYRVTHKNRMSVCN